MWEAKLQKKIWAAMNFLEEDQLEEDELDGWTEWD